MIDAEHAFASWYLWGVGVSFFVAFGAPLLIAPVWWARTFRWEVPADVRLVRYLGRCLGAVACAIIVQCLRAAPAPAAHVGLFDLIIGAGALLFVVHVVGAIERAQPWTETAEIGVYALATGLAIAARLTLTA